MNSLAAALILIGVAFCLLGALGVLRLPDVLIRLNAATKAATLGVGCVLAGVAVSGVSGAGVAKLLLAILLQFATAPIAGHVIGRAAHASAVPLWRGTTIDDLAPVRDRAADD
ncbi:monovalent cation/H(+) antiporter subunit G [soil metagenome]|jgi:multicomponent Na+:H+ antiporter subunit G